MDAREAQGCSSPPPLTEDEISAAADGNAPRRVRAHLERCAFCAERVAEVRGFEQALSRTLHRFDCPSAQSLGEFALGLSERSTAADIERHLEYCARCSAELLELRSALEAEPAPETRAAPVRQAGTRRAPRRAWMPHPRLDEIVALLLPRAPALALRGESLEPEPFVAEAGDAVITLEARPAGEGQVRVNGMLAALEQEPWIGALALLWQEGEVRAVATLDENGGFECGPIPAGATTLRIAPEHGPTLVLRDITLR
jgi:hypothetical protein